MYNYYENWKKNDTKNIVSSRTDFDFEDRAIAFLIPDGWNHGEPMYYSPRFIKGFRLRIETGTNWGIESLSVKITKLYPKKHYDNCLGNDYKRRVHFEFVKDGEPNISHKGYIIYYK